MTMLVCAGIAAAVVALWPIKSAIQIPSLPKAQPKPPSYRACIDSLAQVRKRLLMTDGIDDKAKAAIETLTLALVNGSDK